MKKAAIAGVMAMIFLTLAVNYPVLAAGMPVLNGIVPDKVPCVLQVITPISNTHLDVNNDFTMVAPSINLGLMSVGVPTTGHGIFSVSTDSNSWIVNVSDTTTEAPKLKGCMTNTNNIDQLHDELKIDKTTPANNDASNGFSYSGEGNSGDLDFYVSQTIESTDAPGMYTITITFTGSY
jgi:hypothetical protein